MPSNADVRQLEAFWLEEVDQQPARRGKGIGEIGIVGTAAAIANAVHNATGVRLRSLPFRIDDVRQARRSVPSAR